MSRGSVYLSRYRVTLFYNGEASIYLRRGIHPLRTYNYDPNAELFHEASEIVSRYDESQGKIRRF